MFVAIGRRRRHISRRAIGLVLAPFVAIGAIATSSAMASSPPNSATISAPSCGNNTTITLSAPGTSTVHFELDRSTQTGAWDDFYVTGPRSTTVKVTTSTPQTLTIKVGTTVLAQKAVAPSATACPAGTPVLPTIHPTISASISSPVCGSGALVTLHNPTGNANWFEVWRNGRKSADEIAAVGHNNVASLTEDLGSSTQTIKVVWDGKTLAASTVKPGPSCSGTPSTSTTTTLPKATTTTVPRTTTTLAPVTTTVPPTTTTTIPTTTTLPPCTSGDQPAGWGCPASVDNFTGTSIDTNNWYVYDTPSGSAPRSNQNVREQNGELQLVGTYNPALPNDIMSAGVAQQYAQEYGRWEVRARADNGAGYSFASTLWPTGVWPTDGEIDLFENPDTPRTAVMNTLHNDPQNQQTNHWNYNIDVTQWHTYAVEWTPSHVQYYIDNKLVFTVTTAYLIPKTSPMHLTLQFDARRPNSGCGGWYQCPNSATPAETIMHVDYIKVWKLPPGMS